MDAEWVDLKWLKERTGYRHPVTLKRKILDPYREELEKFIYYPKAKGEKWKINKQLMEKWLSQNIA